jgi:hypothetical protein
MSYTHRVCIAIFTCLSALITSAQPVEAQGPASRYYLTNGDGTILQVAQSGAVVTSWSTASTLYPLAVTNTVKVYNRGSGATGNGFEYTLSGTPTGVTFPWQGGPTGELLDGGTDAFAHNYASEWTGGNGIWQYTLNWTTPVKLFTAPVSPIGITYDRNAGSLWISLDGGNIQQVTNTGTVLSQFNPGPGRWGALAWEPATDTLWAHSNGSGILRQWTKTGTLLQQANIPALSSNIWGGEFSVNIPEPTVLTSAIVGVLLLIGVRQKRRALQNY